MNAWLQSQGPTVNPHARAVPDAAHAIANVLSEAAWPNNICVESLWRSLKFDAVSPKAYESPAQVHHMIRTYRDFNRKLSVYASCFQPFSHCAPTTRFCRTVTRIEFSVLIGLLRVGQGVRKRKAHYRVARSPRSPILHGHNSLRFLPKRARN
jgi:hypothetical protein